MCLKRAKELGLYGFRTEARGYPPPPHRGHRRRQKAVRDKWWSMAFTFFLAVSGLPGTPSEGQQLHHSGCSEMIWFQIKCHFFFYQHVNSTKPKVPFSVVVPDMPHIPIHLWGFLVAFISWSHLLWNLPLKVLFKSLLPFRWNDSGQGCSPCS